MPKISILTFVKNSKSTIVDTIDSVRNQTTNADFEYIVVDGNSSDGTIDIVKCSLDIVNRYVSEEDRGIVDAQNKAIHMSDGDYVFCLNADDWIPPNFISNALIHIEKYGVDIIYGDVDVFDVNKKYLHTLNGDPNFFIKKSSLYQMPRANFPTMLIKKSVFDRVGMFDERFKVCPDFEWLIRAQKQMCSFKYSPSLKVAFRLGGNSDLMHLRGLLEARAASRLNNGNLFLSNYFFTKRLLLHYARRVANVIMPDKMYAFTLDLSRRFFC